MSIHNKLFTNNKLFTTHSLWSGTFAGLSSFAYPLAVGKLPGDKDVLRELHKIIGKDPIFKEPTRSMTLDIDWLNSALKNIAKVLHDPLLITLGIAALLGLYFLIRAILPYVQGKSLPGRAPRQLSHHEKELPPNHFLTLYQLALEQSQAEQYRQALISLHKATVEYLLTKVIIAAPQKKYTNNDLKRKLFDDKTLYQPFCIITGYAEIAGFSTMEINPADFSRALEIFETFFL